MQISKKKSRRKTLISSNDCGKNCRFRKKKSRRKTLISSNDCGKNCDYREMIAVKCCETQENLLPLVKALKPCSFYKWHVQLNEQKLKIDKNFMSQKITTLIWKITTIFILPMPKYGFETWNLNNQTTSRLICVLLFRIFKGGSSVHLRFSLAMKPRRQLVSRLDESLH